MAIRQLILKINIFIEHPLNRVGVHINRNGSIMNGERIGRFDVGLSSTLILLCHLFEVAGVEHQECHDDTKRGERAVKYRMSEGLNDSQSLWFSRTDF